MTTVATGRTKEEQEYRKRAFYWILKIWKENEIPKILLAQSGKNSTSGSTELPSQQRRQTMNKLKVPSVFTRQTPATTAPAPPARVPTSTTPARRAPIPEIRITAATPVRRSTRGENTLLPRGTGARIPVPTYVNRLEDTEHERIPSSTALMAPRRIGKRCSSEKRNEVVKKKKLQTAATLVAGLIGSKLRASSRNISGRIPSVGITKDSTCTPPESTHNDRLSSRKITGRKPALKQETVIEIEDDTDTARRARAPNTALPPRTVVTTSARTRVDGAEGITQKDGVSLLPSEPRRRAQAKKTSVPSKRPAPPQTSLTASPHLMRCKITRTNPADAKKAASLAKRLAASKQARDSSRAVAKGTDALNP